MTLTLFLVYVGLQGTFAWARIAVFRIDVLVTPGVRLIEASASASIVTGGVLIAERKVDDGGLDVLALSAGFIAAALLAWGLHSVRPMQLSVAFSSVLPEELLTTGAFAFVRHPFYLAKLIAHALPFAASRSDWALFQALWLGAIYTCAAMLEERQLLASSHAVEFRRYAAVTGRFLPRLACLIGRRR